MQKFRLLTAQVKSHQICTLIGSFCWKCIKFQLKKYRGVISQDTEEWCKIWRKTKLLSQKWQEFGEFWSEPFDWFLSCKHITFDLQKYKGVIFQNLKKNWHVVWKMTWGIWQIFIRTLESVKIGTFMGSFCPK